MLLRCPPSWISLDKHHGLCISPSVCDEEVPLCGGTASCQGPMLFVPLGCVPHSCIPEPLPFVFNSCFVFLVHYRASKLECFYNMLQPVNHYRCGFPVFLSPSKTLISISQVYSEVIPVVFVVFVCAIPWTFSFLVHTRTQSPTSEFSASLRLLGLLSKPSSGSGCR